MLANYVAIYLPVFYIIYRVYKDFENWQEATIDCLAFSLYQLQMFYLNEIKRGMSGSGEYHLKDRYQCLKVDHYAFQCVSIDSPESIVKNMREADASVLPESKESDQNVVVNVRCSSTLESVKVGKHNKALYEDESEAPEILVADTETCLEPEGTIINIRKDFDKPSKLDMERYIQSKEKENEDELNPNRSTPHLARAYQVMKNQNITYDTKFGVFIIKEPKEVARVVSLFPKVTCSCPSTGCYHILAAKINLGMNVGSTNITDLSKLRKNSKKKKEKCSERKRPRPLSIFGKEKILIKCMCVNVDSCT